MRRLIGLLCVIALSAACSEPPQKEIDRAQGAIDAARAAGAERYASAEFVNATTALQEAHDAVAQRDYRFALSRALDAGERAQQSARQAADGKARVRGEAEALIAATATAYQQLLSATRAAEASRVPAAIVSSARQTATRTDATLQKARALVKSEQYLEARETVKGTTDRVGAQIRALSDAQKPRATRRRG